MDPMATDIAAAAAPAGPVVGTGDQVYEATLAVPGLLADVENMKGLIDRAHIAQTQYITNLKAEVNAHPMALT